MGKSRTQKYYDKNPKAKKKKKAYDTLYNAKPEQKKRRAARNKSRDKMKKKGKVSKGQDVHHKDNDPTNTSESNLKAESKKKNRGRK